MLLFSYSYLDPPFSLSVLPLRHHLLGCQKLFYHAHIYVIDVITLQLHIFHYLFIILRVQSKCSTKEVKTLVWAHLSAQISSLPFLPPFHTVCSSNLGLQPFKLLAVSEYAMFHISTAFSVTSCSPQFCQIPLVFQILLLESLPYPPPYIFT